MVWLIVDVNCPTSLQNTRGILAAVSLKPLVTLLVNSKSLTEEYHDVIDLVCFMATN